jgi:predicted lipoprotein with Yx(FWY)xxD motif
MTTDPSPETDTSPHLAPRRRWLRGTVVAGSLVVAVAVAALAGMATAGVSAVWADAPTVQVGTNPTFGTILTTDSGLALYTLDTDHDGQSTCHGACAAAWPPLNVPAGTGATGGPGVTGTVGTSEQSNGTFQVTYNGAPVYTFVGDSAPGQVTGNGVTGFFVVKVAATATTTTTPSTGGTPGGSTAAGGGPATAGSGAPAAASTSKGPAPSTAPSGSASGANSTSGGSLAFTGAGSGLGWVLLAGLLLLGLGTAAVVMTMVGGRSEETRR